MACSERDDVIYASILQFPRGTFFSLVSRAYAAFADDEFNEQTRRGDDQIFDNPNSVGKCAMVTCLNGEPVGVICFDPRPFPRAVIGQNCVIPRHRGRGLGRAQLQWLLQMLREKDFQTVFVTTSDHPFFVPSHHMYEACGFHEVGRRDADREDKPGLIDYELELKSGNE